VKTRLTFMQSSHERPKVSLRLTLNYRAPSLNVTKRRHWAQQYKEKRKAFRALLSALSDTASALSTPTTSPEGAKTCWTAFDTLASYLATNRGASTLRRDRRKSPIGVKKRQ
jgi:hypothetical protein